MKQKNATPFKRLFWIFLLPGIVRSLRVDHAEHNPVLPLKDGVFVIAGSQTVIQDPTDLLPSTTPWVWLEAGDVIQLHHFTFSYNSAYIPSRAYERNLSESAGQLPMKFAVASLPQMVDLLDSMSRLSAEFGRTSDKVLDPFLTTYFSRSVFPDTPISFGYVIPESQLYFIALLSNQYHVASTWNEQLHPQSLYLQGVTETGTPKSPPADLGVMYSNVSGTTITNYLASRERRLRFAMSMMSGLALMASFYIFLGPVFQIGLDQFVGLSNVLYWRRKQSFPTLTPQCSLKDQALERYSWAFIFLLRSIYCGLGAYQTSLLDMHGSISNGLWLVPRVLASLEDFWMIGSLLYLGTCNRKYITFLNQKERNMVTSSLSLYLYFGMYEALTGEQLLFKRIMQACLVLFLLIFDNLRCFAYRMRLQNESLYGAHNVLRDYRIANVYDMMKYAGVLYLVKGSITMTIQSTITVEDLVSPEARIKYNTPLTRFGEDGPNIAMDDWKAVVIDMTLTFCIVQLCLNARSFSRKELNPLDSRYSYLINKNGDTDLTTTDDVSDESEHLLM